MCERFFKLVVFAFLAVLAVALPQSVEAQSVPPSLIYGVESGGDAPYRLEIGAHGGALHSSEAETGGVTTGNWGVTAQTLLVDRLMIDLRASGRSYQQEYLSPTGPTGEPMAGLNTRETRWDASLNVGYEALGAGVDGTLALAPYVGLALMGWNNQMFPMWTGAPRVGLMLGVRPDDKVRLEGSFEVNFPAFGQSDPGDVLGAPKLWWTYNAAVLMGMSERVSLRLGVIAESVLRQHTYRHSVGAMAGVDISLFHQ